MQPQEKSRRWLFAVATAVIFPALAFHASCIAVMGPGAWGSGMEEAYPEWHQPTERVERYVSALAADAASGMPHMDQPEAPADVEFSGAVRQTFQGREQAVVLTAEGERWTDQQRLYVVEGSSARELPIPSGHVVTNPVILRGRVIYERWNPWAISAGEKLKRYVASWSDVTLRPEVALYAFDRDAHEWNFIMPGHTLVPSPDGNHAVLLRSGAMVAGYYSVHIWSADSEEPAAILSLREADEGSGRSFDFKWTRDSQAVQIKGHTGGFDRREREPREFNLLYVVDEKKIYDLEGAQ